MTRRKKKYNVIINEFGFNDGGIYCILPFYNLGRYERSMFKIGMAENLANRADQYHTDFPAGFRIVSLLHNPNIGQNKNETKKSFLLRVEKFIFTYIVEKFKDKRYYTAARVKSPDKYGWGETEWFYTNQTHIHEAFTEAHKIFGGDLVNDTVHAQNKILRNLVKIDNGKQPVDDVEMDDPDEKKANFHFTGKIYYRFFE